MEKFWPIICEHYGVSGAEQDVSIRQYKLVDVDDVAEDKVYKGEIARLKSYERQRPYEIFLKFLFKRFLYLN